MKIKRAHIVVRKSGNKQSKLLRFRDKQNILRKAKLLKGIDTFINKDLRRDTVECKLRNCGGSKIVTKLRKILYISYSGIVSEGKVPAPLSETEISDFYLLQ